MYWFYNDDLNNLCVSENTFFSRNNAQIFNFKRGFSGSKLDHACTLSKKEISDIFKISEKKRLIFFYPIKCPQEWTKFILSRNISFINYNLCINSLC